MKPTRPRPPWKRRSAPCRQRTCPASTEGPPVRRWNRVPHQSPGNPHRGRRRTLRGEGSRGLALPPGMEAEAPKRGTRQPPAPQPPPQGRGSPLPRRLPSRPPSRRRRRPAAPDPEPGSWARAAKKNGARTARARPPSRCRREACLKLKRWTSPPASVPPRLPPCGRIFRLGGSRSGARPDQPRPPLLQPGPPFGPPAAAARGSSQTLSTPILPVLWFLPDRRRRRAAASREMHPSVSLRRGQGKAFSCLYPEAFQQPVNRPVPRGLHTSIPKQANMPVAGAAQQLHALWGVGDFPDSFLRLQQTGALPCRTRAVSVISFAVAVTWFCLSQSLPCFLCLKLQQSPSTASTLELFVYSNSETFI